MIQKSRKRSRGRNETIRPTNANPRTQPGSFFRRYVDASGQPCVSSHGAATVLGVHERSVIYLLRTGRLSSTRGRRIGAGLVHLIPLDAVLRLKREREQAKGQRP